VGAAVGEALGCGVGFPLLYVGTSVGDAVGALLGEALGWGVGLALIAVIVRDVLIDVAVAAVLRTMEVVVT